MSLQDAVKGKTLALISQQMATWVVEIQRHLGRHQEELVRALDTDPGIPTGWETCWERCAAAGPTTARSGSRNPASTCGPAAPWPAVRLVRLQGAVSRGEGVP